MLPALVAVALKSCREEYKKGTSVVVEVELPASEVSSVGFSSGSSLITELDSVESPLVCFSSRVFGRETRHSGSSSVTRAFNNAQWISTINSLGKSLSV